MAKTATSTKSSAKTTTGTTTAGNKRRPARGGSGAERTGLQNAESGFRASPELSRNLQSVLVDLVELQMQIAEVGADHIPVRLLALEVEFDDVDEYALQRLGQGR